MRVNSLQHFEPPRFPLLRVLKSLVHASLQRLEPPLFALESLGFTAASSLNLMRRSPRYGLSHIVEALLEIENFHLQRGLIDLIFLRRARQFIGGEFVGGEFGLSERIGVVAPGLQPGERRRILSLVDAYIAVVVDRLLPLETAGASLDCSTVWEDFSSTSPSFRSHLVAALHFRRLGWRVRSGLNYGAHFVLYRGDSDVVHSEYIVYVHSDGVLQWPIVQSLTRLAEDVKKTVLLCQVEDVGDIRAGDDDVHCESPRARDCSPRVELASVVELHNRRFRFSGVLIRFWDVATADDDSQDYAFAPQPIVPKKRPQRKPKHDARALGL
ncbi:hypothetical protein P43SY_011135 [Pythium insidiosum]|uniref:tRNA-intron lyase n=1 Tax=Pythium insidiosum TaxID=114742 RepID=A0AAD5LT54_PYTIN|nr:hypothetical protein P43SY_011135 [Pythium insidiosum]